MWDSSKLIIKHGTQGSGYGATTISTGTTYHCWIDWAKGTGADGVMTVYLATTSTKPGSAEVTLSSGTASVDVANVKLKAPSGVELIVDRFIHNPTAIGSAP
jgi:hypothetical protein